MKICGETNQTRCDDFKWNRPELAELVWPHLAAPFSSTFDCTYCMNQTGLILFGLMLKSFLLFKSFELTRLLIFNKFFFDSGHFCECFFFRKRNKCSFRGICYYMWVTDHVEYTKTQNLHIKCIILELFIDI